MPHDGLTTPLDTPLVGREVDGLKLVELLGAGGMGRVFKAWDSRLERHVAVKFLADRLAIRPEFRERFAREARALSAINHPHVAQIYAAGEYEGLPFLVMEHVVGGSREQELASGRSLPLARVVGWWKQAVEGLEAAHQALVIHRDIKPSNLLLDAQARIKIVDFGLARRLDGEAKLTQPDAALGTPSYLAPEQATGGPVDHRADFYSLGATVYHLLSGQPPYDGRSPVAIALQHVQAPLVPLRERAPRVPLALAAVVERCLEKDPARRYPTHAALRAAIAEAERARPVARAAAAEVEPAGATIGPRALWLGVAALVALGVGAALWRGRATPPPAAALRADSAPASTTAAADAGADPLAALDGALAPGARATFVGMAQRAKTLANLRQVMTLAAAANAQEGSLPSGGVAGLVERYGAPASVARDAWGGAIELRYTGRGGLQVVSAGPDRRFDTADDLATEELPGFAPPDGGATEPP